MILERDVEKYLKERVKEMGGATRKCRWLGRDGAPDRRVLGVAWVELKKPGGPLKPHQVREHERMRDAGEIVEVITSCYDVDVFIEKYFHVKTGKPKKLPTKGR